jgi:hypothetical protein
MLTAEFPAGPGFGVTASGKIAGRTSYLKLKQYWGLHCHMGAQFLQGIGAFAWVRSHFVQAFRFMLPSMVSLILIAAIRENFGVLEAPWLTLMSPECPG